MRVSEVCKHAACMAICGATLGTLLDATESNTGVLTYSAPDVHVFGIHTCSWVPPLFALAAIIIGTSTIVAECHFPLTKPPPHPAWNTVICAVVSFSLQYALTGILFNLGWSQSEMSLLLYPLALGHHLYWDPSTMSTVMSVATAFGGPTIEFVLISTNLYSYADASIAGILPTWIFATYFAGGAANALLGRAIWNTLHPVQKVRDS